MDPLTRNGGFIGVTLDFGSEEQYITGGSVSTVTHVGATTRSGGSSLTLPSGLQQDDIVMVFMADDNNNGGSAPSGWTTLVSENFTNSVWNSVWYKIMGTTPDTTVTLPATSAWVASAFRGVDTTTPFDVSYTGPSTGSNASPDSPSITTTTDGCMIISFAGLDDDNSAASTTAPSGYTMSGVEDNDGTCMVAYKKQTTAGAEDPGAFSSTTDAWVGYTFALKPGSTVEYGNYKNSGIWDLQADYESKLSSGVSVTYEDTDSLNSALSNYSFTSVNLGSTGASNSCVIVVHTHSSGSAQQPTSVSAGGVSMTHIGGQGSGGNVRVDMYRCDHTASSGTVAVSYVSSQSACGIGVFNLSTASAAPYDTAATTLDVGVSIDMQEGGCVIAASTATSGASTYTWTNVTEQYDYDMRSGEYISAAISNSFSGSSPLTVSFSNTGSQDPLFVASW